MSATGDLLKQALPQTGTQKTPTGKKVSATEALLKAANVPADALAYTPKELASPPVPTFGQKAKSFAKDVAVDIGKTLTYAPQRIAQTGMALAGKTPEEQNLATSKLLGPVAIPVPTDITPGMIAKEAGRAIQLPALGMGVSTIPQALKAGGVMALGQGLERQDLLSKEGLGTAAATVGITAAIPVIGKALGKAITKPLTAEEVAIGAKTRAGEINIPEVSKPGTPGVVPSITEKATPVKVPKPAKPITPEKYTKYEKALTEDPIYTPGSTSNKNIIDAYTQVEATMKPDDLIDAIYGRNGKVLPENLPATAAYNLIKEDLSKLTPEQINRLRNKQPLSKTGADLRAAQLKRGGFMENPLDVMDATDMAMKEATLTKGVTNKSITSFLDDIECK